MKYSYFYTSVRICLFRIGEVRFPYCFPKINFELLLSFKTVLSKFSQKSLQVFPIFPRNFKISAKFFQSYPPKFRKRFSSFFVSFGHKIVRKSQWKFPRSLCQQPPLNHQHENRKMSVNVNGTISLPPKLLKIFSIANPFHVAGWEWAVGGYVVQGWL